LVKVRPGTVRGWIRDGLLPAVHVPPPNGHTVRVRRADLVAFLEGRDPPPIAGGAEGPRTPMQRSIEARRRSAELLERSRQVRRRIAEGHGEDA